MLIDKETGKIPQNLKIRIITNADIRYEGTLFNLNSSEKTISLKNVTAFGTEDRRKDTFIPPSNTVYEMVVFRSCEIKDLVGLKGEKEEKKEEKKEERKEEAKEEGEAKKQKGEEKKEKTEAKKEKVEEKAEPKKPKEEKQKQPAKDHKEEEKPQQKQQASSTTEAKLDRWDKDEKPVEKPETQPSKPENQPLKPEKKSNKVEQKKPSPPKEAPKPKEEPKKDSSKKPPEKPVEKEPVTAKDDFFDDFVASASKNDKEKGEGGNTRKLNQETFGFVPNQRMHGRGNYSGGRGGHYNKATNDNFYQKKQNDRQEIYYTPKSNQ